MRILPLIQIALFAVNVYAPCFQYEETANNLWNNENGWSFYGLEVVDRPTKSRNLEATGQQVNSSADQLTRVRTRVVRDREFCEKPGPGIAGT